MRYELNGKRLIVVYGGNAWELVGDELYDWHLIRAACTISMPKLHGETFAQFQSRLAKMDAELLLNDAKAVQCP